MNLDYNHILKREKVYYEFSENWTPEGKLKMTDTFIIGSSNAKRVFGENYAGNFLKIANPEKALSLHGEGEIRNFLKNVTTNSVRVIHFLINGLYQQREFCKESKTVNVNTSFKTRSEVLKTAVNKVKTIVRQTLLGKKIET